MKAKIEEPVRLDILAKALLGTERDGALEALLKANPGLAKEGAFLVAPRDVEVPTLPAKTVANVNPWE